MSKIPRVQIKDDLMLTAKPISRLLMIGLTICRVERKRDIELGYSSRELYFAVCIQN